MQWGEMQSLFQLAAQLNIAFYTIKQLREPVVNTTKKELESVGRRIDDSFDDYGVLASANEAPPIHVYKTLVDLRERHSKIQKNVINVIDLPPAAYFEKKVDVAAICMALLAFFALIYCSFNASCGAVEWIAGMLVLVTYLPIGGFMLLNFHMIGTIKQKITQELEDVQLEYYTKVFPKINFVRVMEIRLGRAEK
jgi:hypothetical protein